MYIGSCAGTFYALNKNTGKVAWTYDVDGNSFHGDPVFFDSLVIIPTDAGAYEGSIGPIFAFNMLSGELVWKYDITDMTGLGPGITTDLLIDNISARVIGVTTTSRVICLSARSGQLIWERRDDYDTTMVYWNSSPTLIPGRVVFNATTTGEISMLQLSDGLSGWHTNVGSRVTTSIELRNNAIYFGVEDNLIYRFSDDGNILDSMRLGGTPGYRLSADSATLFVLCGDNSDIGGMNRLSALSLDLSETLWSIATSANSPWSIKQPYLYRGFVVLGDGNGQVYFVNRQSGRIEHRLSLEGVVRSFGHASGILYIGTQGGKIFAVRSSLEQN